MSDIMDPKAPLATFTRTHGTLTVTGFSRLRFGVIRHEVWKSHDGPGEPLTETCHAASTRDLTPRHVKDLRSDAWCGFCFMGSAHTQRAHEKRQRKAVKAATTP